MRFHFIEVIYHIFHYYWGKKKLFVILRTWGYGGSLYRGSPVQIKYWHTVTAVNFETFQFAQFKSLHWYWKFTACFSSPFNGSNKAWAIPRMVYFRGLTVIWDFSSPPPPPPLGVQRKRIIFLTTCPSDKHCIKFGCPKPKSSCP